MTPQDDTAAPALKVGITGGIASGKTAVSDRFAKLGVPVIDTDLLAREVVEPNTEGLRQVVEAFGEAILRADGALDRPALRDLVFADEAARRRLEGILHPLIWQAAAARIQAVRTPYCVVVIPLLAEGGARKRVDRVLLVDCDPATQLERLMRRDGATEAAARRILAAQATREARLAIADDVIVNDGDLPYLDMEVARLHERYSALARAHGR
ncbi:MAG: dephospho-CoA kinase [Pseudomonadota bacterium]